jgi:hypothetical protein
MNIEGKRLSYLVAGTSVSLRYEARKLLNFSALHRWPLGAANKGDMLGERGDSNDSSINPVLQKETTISDNQTGRNENRTVDNF